MPTQKELSQQKQWYNEGLAEGQRHQSPSPATLKILEKHERYFDKIFSVLEDIKINLARNATKDDLIAVMKEHEKCSEARFDEFITKDFYTNDKKWQKMMVTALFSVSTMLIGVIWTMLVDKIEENKINMGDNIELLQTGINNIENTINQWHLDD
jgi:hypothetical protein